MRRSVFSFTVDVLGSVLLEPYSALLSTLKDAPVKDTLSGKHDSTSACARPNTALSLTSIYRRSDDVLLDEIDRHS